MKNRKQRFLSVLMTVMMLVSMIPSALADDVGTSNAVGISGPVTFALSSSEHNLSSFITEKKITPSQGYDKNGALIGESIRVELSFLIPPRSLKSGDTLIKNWYISKNDLQLAGWQQKGETKIIKEGKLQGKYWIEEDYVHIELADDYLREAYNGIGVEGTLWAAGNWSKGENSDENKWVIKVGEDEYTVYPNGVGNIKVNKRGSGPDTDGYITWTIVVEGTEGGTNGDITLTDIPQAGKYTDEEPIIVQLPDGAKNKKWENGKLTVTLPKLADGAKHTIVLKTKLTDDAKKIAGNVTNAVTVESKGYNEETIKDNSTGQVTITVKKAKVSKSGYYDQWNCLLNVWTINVNSDRADITGMTLTDTLNGAGFNWATASNLTINPTTGYTINGNTITFTQVNGQPNTQSYTITYRTTPTPKTETSSEPGPTGVRNEKGYYDVNKVYLKDGNKIVAKDEDNTIDRSMSNENWLQKWGAFDKNSRIVTWTVVINGGHGDLSGKTFDDYLPGRQYEFIEITYNKTRCTTLSELVAAVNTQILADIQNGYRYKSYTVKYLTRIPAGVTSITNTAWIGSVEKGSTVETGVGPDMIWKQGDVDSDPSYIKWTITLNPYAQKGAVIPQGATFGDELATGSPNTAFATEKPVQVNVISYNANGAQSGSQSSSFTATSIANMCEQLNAAGGVIKSSYGKTDRIEITYWTKIIAPGKVQNTASFAGQSGSDSEEYWFNYAVSKNFANVTKIEEDDEYKLQWSVDVATPSRTNLGEAVTIRDELTGNHYLKLADLEGIRAAAAALDVKNEATIVSISPDNDSQTCKGFVITLPNGLKKNGSNVRLTYYSYVKSADYAGNMVNKVILTASSLGDNRKESSAEMTPGADLRIRKDFTGETIQDEKTKAADLDKLQWTITMPVPEGTSGKQIQIVDTLPDGIQLTNVLIAAGDNSFSRLAINGSINSSGSLTGCTGVSVWTSWKNLTVAFNGCTLAKGTTLKVVVTAKATDDLRKQLSNTPLAVTNKVYATANNGRSNDADSTIYLVKVDTEPNVAKAGYAPAGLYNTAEYEVTVNPKGKKLLTTVGGTLKLQDILTVNVTGTMLQGASDLNLVLAKAVTITDLNGQPVSGCVVKPEVISVNGNVITATIDMEVPDQKALKLTYQYRLEGTPVKGAPANKQISFTNRVVLNGEEFEGSDNSVPVVTYEFDADVILDTVGVSFVKIEDGNAGLPIEGAVFSLYKGNTCVATGTSGADGRVVFAWNEGYNWERNVVYRLQEDSVPEYWVQDAEDIVFSIGAAQGATVEYEIYANGTVHYVSNSSATTSIQGEKKWKDDNNAENRRPESVTLRLYADGVATSKTTTTSENQNWKYQFENLKKYKENPYQYSADQREIVYTVQEENVPTGYTVSYNGLEVINALTGKTNVSGTKTWKDNNNEYNTRPSSITISLVVNGQVVTDPAPQTVTSENGWAWKFENLDQYDANGKKIEYSIQEQPILTNDGDRYLATLSESGYDLTNELDGKTKVNGTKIWDDADNQDGKRPKSITIYVKDGSVVVDTILLSAGEDGIWQDAELEFESKELPKYRDGKLIAYTVEENVDPWKNVEEKDKYTATVEQAADGSFNVKNSYKPETVDISGKKTWDDAGNQDGKRPSSIIVNLFADGEPVKSQTVSADESGNWNWTFSNEPMYKDGKVIQYSVTEEVVSQYTTTYENVDGGIEIINSYTPGETGRTVQKVWLDNDDQDGIRPKSITVQLLANGEVYRAPVELNEENNWTYTWTKLPVNEPVAQEILYTVKEIGEVPGYITDYSGDTFTITNTHEPEVIEISGSKTWSDADNQDGIRPTSITIALMADGKPVASKIVTAANGWKWSFINLPKYRDHGTPIVYTITEGVVKGYETGVNGYDVINSHEPETIEVSGSKTWNDENNQDGIRPTSITINLLADGEKIASKTVTGADGWKWSFDDLPKFRDQGIEIVYTITEEAVAGYDSEVIGYDVINTHVPETIEISGGKTWNDENDQDGIRPTSITINLLADGEKIASKTVTGADGWSWVFENLPKFRDQGVEIVYTITEDAVEGYETTVNGYNVVNTHVPEIIEISGGKTWRDGNNADGIRPTSITINLLANGELIESRAVTRADGWRWTFVDLPKYADGVEIVYTITEEPVRGYQTEVNGYNLINRHTPEPTPTPIPTVTPEPEPTPTPTPTPTIPEEVKRATRKPVDGAIISTITILDDAVPLFGGRGTGDTMPYAVGGLSLAAVLLLVSAYIAKKRSGKHNG